MNAVASPSHSPKQLASSAVVVALSGFGSVITTVETEMQPLSSVTVTPYVPAQSPVIVSLAVLFTSFH